jgi:hypothetical protein
MVVKEIVQGLVDDNMVDTERIGTSNYFWAFPSKAMNAVCFLYEKHNIILTTQLTNL